jgi:hypothetical protein
MYPGQTLHVAGTARPVSRFEHFEVKTQESARRYIIATPRATQSVKLRACCHIHKTIPRNNIFEMFVLILFWYPLHVSVPVGHPQVQCTRGDPKITGTDLLRMRAF